MLSSKTFSLHTLERTELIMISPVNFSCMLYVEKGRVW